MSAPLSKILMIAGALLLSVLLFFAPKLPPADFSKSEKPEGKTNVSLSAEIYLRNAEKNLSPALAGRYGKLKSAQLNDSLITIWTSLRRPDFAAFFAEKKAAALNTSEAWLDAGNRYYYSTQFVADKTEIPVLFQCAIRSYEKVLEKDPDNNDARIMLASCYVDGSEDPMKGISLLREVEKTDSNNVKLQLTFAFFSAKSGQHEKAVSRFKKVLQLDSTYLEAYLHLADMYEQMGNNDATIEMLKRYSVRTTDITAKLEVEKYIKQIEGTN